MESQAPVSSSTQPQEPFMGAFELFKPSINIIKLNLGTFLALILAPFAILIADAFLMFGVSFSESTAVNTSAGILATVIGIIGVIGLFLTGPGLIVTQLKGARGQKIAPMPAFKEGLKYFWRLLGLTILQTLLFAVAAIALLVPFFFAYRRYMLAQYYLIDRNVGIMEAFRLSAQDSITYKSPMWGLVGVSSLLMFGGIIPFLSYVIWIGQVLYGAAPAYRYKEITDASKTDRTKEELSPAESLKEVL